MQAGVDLWEAAGWLGMTVEQLEANYGRHHPDFQEEAAEAFSGRRGLIFSEILVAVERNIVVRRFLLCRTG
jgi:hypothetical protein